MVRPLVLPLWDMGKAAANPTDARNPNNRETGILARETNIGNCSLCKSFPFYVYSVKVDVVKNGRKGLARGVQSRKKLSPLFPGEG